MNQQEIARQLAQKTGTITYAEEQKALHKQFSAYDCVVCKLISGSVLFGFGSLNIMRLSQGLFYTLPWKQRAFQVVATGGVFLFSLSQFYIMYDLLKKRKMKENPFESMIEPLGFTGRLRRNLGGLFSQEHDRQQILSRIEAEEERLKEPRIAEKSID